MPVAWCSCVRCREVKEQLMMLAGHCSQHRVTFDLAVDIVVFLMCSLILHVRRSTTALRSSTCQYATLLYLTPPTQFAHTVLLIANGLHRHIKLCALFYLFTDVVASWRRPATNGI